MTPMICPDCGHEAVRDQATYDHDPGLICQIADETAMCTCPTCDAQGFVQASEVAA